jgi:hypothetical protein
MLSRILNIWIIKQRIKWPKVPKPDSDASGSNPGVTEYICDLGHGRIVCLRGRTPDLQAITTSTWLKAKTHIEGFLEAAAKLTVYLVAAFSGNLSQIGSIIFLGLLLLTAALLGLSNAHTKTFSMHGRLAYPTTEDLPPGTPGSPPYPDSGQNSSSWPSPRDDITSSGFSPMDSFAERGQAEHSVRSPHSFDKSVDSK